ncbi:hypothetical protein SBOR_1927 [Sclerotinia borealis F-4128]|uniref:DUF202 domain-containing protein n=1 Tax=Sclerotinia borealis (strain F-4128) TaxID=1432307 RepID=W9CP97_SCLBF|nr:hypothetical protein SBOR_1927 [Sclerotinia borealis F-4128]
MSRNQEEEGQEPQRELYSPFYFLTRPAPVDVANHHGESVFLTAPLLGPLLFDNIDSDCRDHCANERTFLSYLRLSIYMTIVSLAIILSFHLKSTPTDLELRMAQPLGIIFWVLSLVCLALGFGNYMKTVNKYSRRVAIVQSGWKTQGVSGAFSYRWLRVGVGGL